MASKTDNINIVSGNEGNELQRFEKLWIIYRMKWMVESETLVRLSLMVFVINNLEMKLVKAFII
jgi:hypothetical protein